MQVRYLPTKRRSITLADIKQREPKDLTRIHVHDDLEVGWWSESFSVTPQELPAAEEELGPSSGEVQKKLHQAAKESFTNGGED